MNDLDLLRVQLRKTQEENRFLRAQLGLRPMDRLISLTKPVNPLNPNTDQVEED